MSNENVLFVLVTIIAISSFVGLIILAILLGVQIQRSNELERQNKTLEERNNDLQAQLSLMNTILARYLETERQNYPTAQRRAEINEMLKELNQMHTLSVNVNASNVGHGAEVGQVASGKGIGQDKS